MSGSLFALNSKSSSPVRLGWPCEHAPSPSPTRKGEVVWLPSKIEEVA